MEETAVLTAAEADAGLRVDVYMSKQLDMSRSFAGSLVKGRNVQVNGVVVKANYRMNVGDTTKVLLSAAEEISVGPEDIPLNIVYEDADIIVINKRRGMVVHPAAGNPSGTLVNALLYHCRGELSGINGLIRPGIVHRLDKDTSGLMVAAKTDAAHRGLAEQIKSHSACRVYTALVHGNIVESKGCVDAPVGRHPKDRIKMAVNLKNGKEAVTHFTVLERYGEYTLIECRLETGRTHQIRVHMAYISHPVVNDPLYGYKRDAFPISGQTLHSRALDLVHPLTGQSMHFEAPLPDDFAAVVAAVKKRGSHAEI